MILEDIILVDLETTGTNSAVDRIIEIGLIKYDLYGKRNEFTIFVNPQTKIANSDIHGITDDMVANSKTFKDIAEDLYDYFKDIKHICAYNFKFDFGFLQAEFDRVGITLNTKDYIFVDPLEIFRKFVPHTLAGAYKHYVGGEMTNAHRALDDIKATEQVLISQSKIYDELFSKGLKAVQLETVGEVDLISRWFAKDGDNYVFLQGKHKGEIVTPRHSSYLDWISSLKDISLDDRNLLAGDLGEIPLAY